jgi:AcrR family transcriptional regulator
MSLRERQKEKRHQAIIDAALSLIKEKGYSATSIEEIAGKAEVGVGTVYNYFHTKADIIVELYRRDVEGSLSRGKKLMSDPYQDCKQKVGEILAMYAAGYYANRDKSLLKEMYSVIMSEQALASQELIQLDSLLIEQLAGFLVEAQNRGQIRNSVDPADAAYVLFSLAVYDFMLFVTDDKMKFDLLVESITRHTNLVFEGLSR